MRENLDEVLKPILWENKPVSSVRLEGHGSTKLRISRDFSKGGL